MEQYIPKSVLVEEIKRLRDTAFELYGCSQFDSAYNNVLKSINTLEVKEVDLEEETDKWYNNEASKEFENVLYKDIEKCAKHFFELGIKAQKGE